MSSSTSQAQLERVIVLYNTDYDAELIAAGADVSAVAEAAQAAETALRDYGFTTELVGVEGPDYGELFVRLQRDRPQMVFNLCESLSGDARNEPIVPATLDMLRIPYTGANALSLGLCLHKDRTKAVLRAGRVATPDYFLIHELADAERRSELERPYFLKLVHEDASVGIDGSNCVRSREELIACARRLLNKYKQPVLAEQYIDGREVNVTVIGDDQTLQCLPLHEIDFSTMPMGTPNVVTYAAKWEPEHPEYGGSMPKLMTDLSDDLRDRIEETACAAFRILGLRDFGRVDLRIDHEGQPWVIDVNPNCDTSPDAGAARAAQCAGLEYPAFLGKICQLAWSRSVSV